MIKIKNTNNYDEKLRYNGLEIIIPAFGTLEVNELALSVLPEGVIKQEEVRLLNEVPFNNQEIIQDKINTSKLLNEENSYYSG